MDESVITTLTDLVIARDAEPLREALMRLPFTTLEPYALYDLLGQLLDVSTQIGSREMTELLLEVWGESNPTEEKISTFSMLFVQPQVPPEVLRRVVEVVRDVSYDEVATELMQYDDAPILTIAADRLDRAFGGRTYEQATFLRDWARREGGATRLERYFSEVAGSQSPYAPVPDWVRSAPPGERLPTHDALINSLPDDPAAGAAPPSYPDDTHTLAHELVRSLRAGDLVFDDEQEEAMIDVIRQQLNVAGGADRAHFLAHFNRERDELERRLDAGQNDENLFRILGPVNLLTGDRLDGDRVCALWGGCRMLTCNMFERDDSRAGLSYPASEGGAALDEGDVIDYAADWFYLARCHRCDRRIRSRAHAIREPLPYGGWRGCYCSPECLRQAMAIGGNWNQVTAWTLQQVIEQLRSTGIQDRAPDPRPSWEDETPASGLLSLQGEGLGVEAAGAEGARGGSRGQPSPRRVVDGAEGAGELDVGELIHLLGEEAAGAPLPWE